MSANVILPVAVFAGMGGLVLYALWRIVVVGGEARREAQAMRVASDVAHRADACISVMAAELDRLRHGRVAPAASAGCVASGLSQLRSLADEGRSSATQSRSPAVANLAEDLDRALRSLELIESGRQQLASAPGQPGDGEQSVKRGYLNLLHARDSIRRRGAEVGASIAPAPALRAAPRR